MENYVRKTPAGRMGAVGDTANLTSYLAKQAPDYLSGQDIAVDELSDMVRDITVLGGGVSGSASE